MGTQKSVFRDFGLNLKVTGWLPAIGCILILATVLVISFSVKNEGGLNYAHRVIEAIVPLVFGLQAAFLLTPENEPTIELLLSYPTPLPKLLWKRIVALSLLYCIIAFIATLVVAALTNNENIGLACLRWLASGIVLSGIAIFTSQLTRQGVFGALLTISAWSGSLYGGDALIKVWPYLWPLHIYLQPKNTTLPIYMVNRLSLIVIGAGLMIAASFLLRNEERALGIK
jgi:hypothetical protein